MTHYWELKNKNYQSFRDYREIERDGGRCSLKRCVFSLCVKVVRVSTGRSFPHCGARTDSRRDREVEVRRGGVVLRWLKEEVWQGCRVWWCFGGKLVSPGRTKPSLGPGAGSGRGWERGGFSGCCIGRICMTGSSQRCSWRGTVCRCYGVDWDLKSIFLWVQIKENRSLHPQRV